MKSMKLVWALLFLFGVFFMWGCAASMHAGMTTVPKPSMTETNAAVWLNYWQDQFDGYQGNVVSPQSEKYPQAAVDAYQRAKMEWNRKVETAATNSQILIYGGSIVATLIIVLVATGGL